MEVCVDLCVIKINSTLYDTVHSMIKWEVCVDLGVIKINSALYDAVHNMIK